MSTVQIHWRLVTLVSAVIILMGHQMGGTFVYGSDTRVKRHTGFLHRADECGEVVFARLLHQYAYPSTCMMVFCNGACSTRADACDALSHRPILDFSQPGRLLFTQVCASESMNTPMAERSSDQQHFQHCAN